jgi:importin subunit beta-1
VIQEKSNQILTAVVQGMRKEEPSADVRVAGTTALLNALEFVKANFEKEVCAHFQHCTRPPPNLE